MDAEVSARDGRLLDSWRRSESYGVSDGQVAPVFTGTVDRESLFYLCGREVLSGLQQTLADEPVGLMLTDADGLVLERFSGDSGLLRTLDDVHLAPGFGFSEREVGTNGLGLALADRMPTVVHAEQHYAASLRGYTCAAVPVLDPVTGALHGSINLTTWSKASSDLLLALAQAAAGTTAALMLARSRGHQPRPQSRGEVFRVQTGHLAPGTGTLAALSCGWRQALGRATTALATGAVVAVVGEPGSGRATLAAQALRAVHPRDRILGAVTPAPQDVETWLSLWTPELGKGHTGTIVRHVDALPVWAAQRLRDIVEAERVRRRAAGEGPLPLLLTADDLDSVPAQLTPLLGAVVAVPPLRERPGDILPVAEHVGRRLRGREVRFTPAAQRALTDCAWPGNLAQLAAAVRAATRRTDVVDVSDLPGEVLSRGGHRLVGIEALERDAIARALSRRNVTVAEAARELGVSRATIYRKLAQYDLRIPGRGRRD